MKCLIVDDEKAARGSVRRLLQQMPAAPDQFLEAENGRDALRLIARERPEIVITDMHTDIMNGTGLLGELENAPLPPQIIVVSGHSDYESMRSAILAGAVDYLLKPVNAEALENALLRALRRSGMERPGFRDGEAYPDRDAYILSRYNEIAFSRSFRDFLNTHADCMLLCVRILHLPQTCAEQYHGIPELLVSAVQHEIDRKLQDIPHLCTQVPGEHFGSFLCVLSLESGKNAAYVRRQASALLDQAARDRCLQLLLAFSGPFASFVQLPHALREIIERMNRQPLKMEGNGALVCGELPEKQLLAPQEREALVNLVLGGDLEEILDGIKEFLAKRQQGSGLSFQLLDRVHHLLCTTMNDRFRFQNPGSGGMSDAACREMAILLHDALPDLDVVRALLAKLLGPYQALLSASASQTVNRILSYIAANYQERISLGTLSERFFISREYISRLFKKETGISFIKYLTDIRLRHASELLLLTDLSLNEIAQNVGFSDSAYLIRVFKNRYRLTPMEYRKKKHI